MDTVTIKQALDIIDTGKTVAITYVSFDKKRKTGGAKRFLPELIVTNPKNKPVPEVKTKSTVPSNNVQNHTRNFYTCINGKPTSNIRRVHVFLILEIDGKTVMV